MVLSKKLPDFQSKGPCACFLVEAEPGISCGGCLLGGPSHRRGQAEGIGGQCWLCLCSPMQFMIFQSRIVPGTWRSVSGNRREGGLICQEAVRRVHPCWDFAEALGHLPLTHSQRGGPFIVVFQSTCSGVRPWGSHLAFSLLSCVSLSQCLNLSQPQIILLSNGTVQTLPNRAVVRPQWQNNTVCLAQCEH